ncbi:MAG: DUF1761 domain-containing protein [Thermoplasmatota archaeon]
MDPNSFSFSGLNWLGLALAVVANIVIGFIWYAKWTPTGRTWMKAMNIPADAKPTGGQMAKGLILMLVGSFLLMFVFAHNFWVYQDAYRNAATGGNLNDRLGLMDGIMGGLFTWLGFFVPQHWSGVAWEGKPWSLFFVQAGYTLATMLVAGILLVTVGTTG